MKIGEWFDNLPLPGLIKDIIFVIVVVGAISLISQLILGLWTPMVAVESGSMVPNLNIGDIILVQGASRTNVTPWDEAEKVNYTAFKLELPISGLVERRRTITEAITLEQAGRRLP